MVGYNVGGGGGSGGGGPSWWGNTPINGHWVGKTPKPSNKAEEGKDPDKKPKDVWVKIFSFDYQFVNHKILTNSRKQVLKRKGKILKNSSGVIDLTVYASLGIDASHINCLVCDCLVDSTHYNSKQNDEASEAFFSKGLNESSLLTIRAKWQAGHYPPEINNAKFKVVDWHGNEFETGYFALSKSSYGNVINIHLARGKISIGTAK